MLFRSFLSQTSFKKARPNASNEITEWPLVCYLIEAELCYPNLGIKDQNYMFGDLHIFVFSSPAQLPQENPQV